MAKNTILKFTLFVLMIFFAFLFWWSIDSAINIPGASIWLLPIVWFSCYFVIFALGVILIREAYLAEIAILLSLLLSMLFVFNWIHLLVIVLAFLFLTVAVIRIRKDLHLNIKISLWKTIRTGSTLIIFSLSLIVSSQYYFEIKNSSNEKLIPKFSMGGFSQQISSKILMSMYPNLNNLDGDNLTVDQLILKTGSNQTGETNTANLTAGQKEIILQEGRKQISEIIGENVTGNENVSALFSDAINNKINNYLVPKLTGNSDLPILPVIMTFILLLTVLSLGSFLSPLWILLADVVFIILVKAKVVAVSKVMREVEVIE